MSGDGTPGPARRRERSARYPGVPLAEAIELCRSIEKLGLDGLDSAAIASGLGYSSIKTNTFSARLSATRQFGLLGLKDERYRLTSLARSILHPKDSAELPGLHRQAFLCPPLYAELAARHSDRRLPEPMVLANVLYREHQITASAKDSAAGTFLESARFAGVLGGDSILRVDGSAPPAPSSSEPEPAPPQPPQAEVRIELRLWGPDTGKVVGIQAPEAMTPASFERLMQAIRLHVRIEEPGS